MTRTLVEPGAAVTPRAAGLPARLGVVIGSHWVIDVYSAFVPPLLGVLEVRCELSASQTAWLLGIGSLSSGVSQPLAAWLSDRIDSRLFGAVGLVLAAACLCSIGSATSFATLMPLYVVGMIGVGIFHPIGASSTGQMASRLAAGRRSPALSVFFVAGMLGGITGALLATRIVAAEGGFELMRYFMVPGLVAAGALHLAIRRAPHRDHAHHDLGFSGAEIRRRWFTVSLLYLGNAMRFTVNIALLYLFVRWAQAPVAAAHPGWSDREVAEAAAATVGNLNALVVAGMAVGGLAAGTLIRAGAEKWPLVVIPVVSAPFVVLFPGAGTLAAYAMAVLMGIGFASMIPVTMGLSQRLLPHRTSLASGLMLGGAWAVAIVGPVLASQCLNTWGLGLERTFALTAGLLALSGLLGLPIRRDLLARVAVGA